MELCLFYFIVILFIWIKTSFDPVSIIFTSHLAAMHRGRLLVPATGDIDERGSCWTPRKPRPWPNSQSVRF